MKAEIIAIGTEIILGDIINSNGQYIAKKLAELGISTFYQTAVGDNPGRIKEVLEIAINRSDIVITTGGLGPTKDDLSKEIVAEYFNRELILNNDALEKVKAFFKKINRDMPQSNIKQAMLPIGSIIVNNDNGTAPGCIIEEGNKVVILLPGPPKELKGMFETTVFPYLTKYSDGIIKSKTLKVNGLGESQMEEMVQDIIEEQSNPTIAPYAKEGEVTLRITAKGATSTEALNLIEPVENKVRERLGTYIYGEDESTIEDSVIKLLSENNLTISIAESCTGGLFSARLVNCPGASSVFMEGLVTYSNESKVKRLNVSEDTINKYGAVSEETAKEMAEGVAKLANTNIGLSVTGIAGPEGGTDEKPVGLVYLGLYIDGKVKSKRLMLWGDRQKVRNLTTLFGLGWLRREVLRNFKQL